MDASRIEADRGDMVNASGTLSERSQIQPTLSYWLASLASHWSADEQAVIRRACECALAAHEGQRRASGEPYFHHVLAVADILVELRLDHEAIAAAILHDVVEDTPIGLQQVQEQFGDVIARLVDGVTKLGNIPALREKSTAAGDAPRSENLRKMLLAMAEDVRVVLIKLADRLHNMRTLSHLSEDKQQRIARETMDIYAPLANRLGIWQMKWELEDLSFRYLQPDAYHHIAGMLAEKRRDREQYIDEFVNTLQQSLENANVSARVTGRPKHIYGIWKKMRGKSKSFDQIYDVRAVRVVVDEVRDCYGALGVVHSLWQYIPGEFDDYIATPKENNYRSIHTAVVGPEGRTVEVQIRTLEMHKQSEYGVAAHWRYKEGRPADGSFDEKIAWLRQLLEWQDEVASDFVDHFKSEVFSDRVYVFTPKGNIVDLPSGATPLDFAYKIHTEVGHRCRGAKVDGRIVPLTYALQTGDKLEVLTVKKGGPSRDWLNPHLGYVNTSRARSKIQSWIRHQDHDNNVSSGRSSLERELKRLGVSGLAHEQMAQQLGFDGVDEFYAALGRGELKTARILSVVQALTEPATSRIDNLPSVATVVSRSRSGSSAINIEGVGNLMTSMGGCCRPLPGDPIVGYITRGRGVTIHRRDCANVLHYITDARERLVEVSWGNSVRENAYPVDIQITAYDRSGLLRDITQLLSNEHVNVLSANTHTDRNSNEARILLTVEISGIDRLSRVLARLEQLSNVIEVRRRTG